MCGRWAGSQRISKKSADKWIADLLLAMANPVLQLLVEYPPKYSVSVLVNAPKGNSSRPAPKRAT